MASNDPPGPSGRLTPARALDLYEPALSLFERKEVLEYDDVFFVGQKAVKIQAPLENGHNHGYDDSKGDYKLIPHDHVAYRYEVLSDLGRGSFGQVVKAYDYKRGGTCALKVIRNRRRFHQQAQIEIRILDHLRARDPSGRSGTVRMINRFVFRGHNVLVFELHAQNLYELARLNRYRPFPPGLVRRFTGQLLVSLAFLRHENIVHCDVKPENVLLRQPQKTALTLIDFGSSCFESERLHSYVQSRFYRAPEIMLGLPYGPAIDAWSLGCCVAEMALGQPVFPGASEPDQLRRIVQVLGSPPLSLLDRSPRRSKFFDQSSALLATNTPPTGGKRPTVESGAPPSNDHQAVLERLKRALGPTADDSFTSFVALLLKWDPRERATPTEAMRHEWIRECFEQPAR